MYIPEENEACAKCTRFGCPDGRLAYQVPADVTLLVVAERPTEEDLLEGRPFSGTSGKILRSTLQSAGADMSAVAYAYAVQCGSGEATPAQVRACSHSLQDLIRQTRPRAVLALGSDVAKSLFPDERAAMPNLVGTTRVLSYGDAPEDRTLVCFTYDTDYVLRLSAATRIFELYHLGISTAVQASKGTAKLAGDIGEGMVLTVPKTLEEVSAALERVSQAQGTVAYDVETRHAGVYGTTAYARANCLLSVGFGLPTGESIVIPCAHAESPWHAKDQDGYAVVAPELAGLLRDWFDRNRHVNLVAHNAQFDYIATYRFLGATIRGRLDDSMVMHALATTGDVAKDLKSNISRVFGIPDYAMETVCDVRVLKLKDAAARHADHCVKYQPRGSAYTAPADYSQAPLDLLAWYNGLDVFYTCRFYPLLLDALKSIQPGANARMTLYDWYDKVLRKANVSLARLAKRGMWVDGEVFEQVKTKLREELETLRVELRKDPYVREATVCYALQKRYRMLDKDLLGQRLVLDLNRASCAKWYLQEMWNDKPNARTNPDGGPGWERLKSYFGGVLPATKAELTSVLLSSPEFAKQAEDVVRARLQDYVKGPLYKEYDENPEFAGEYMTPSSPDFNLIQLVVLGHTDPDRFMRSMKTNRVSVPKTFWADQASAHPDKEASVYWKIGRYRLLDKLLGTYCSSLDSTYLDYADGRVHALYGAANTRTGRLSSTDPNLQNLPTSVKYIKSYYSAPPGRQILQVDFSQAEVRVLASLSQDEGLIGICDSGEDIHSAVAKQVFHLDCEVKDVKTKYPDKRRDSKRVVFGLLLTAA